MTASKQFKGLLAGVAAVTLIGTAMAQGTPPNPAIKSAPVGAGQQSTQKTPMGDTGTPTGASTATGSMTGSTNMGSTSSSGGKTSRMTSGSTSGTASMGSGSTSADTSRSTRSKRTARADRN